jgi:hypothetical protein
VVVCAFFLNFNRSTGDRRDVEDEFFLDEHLHKNIGDIFIQATRDVVWVSLTRYNTTSHDFFFVPTHVESSRSCVERNYFGTGIVGRARARGTWRWR